MNLVGDGQDIAPAEPAVQVVDRARLLCLLVAVVTVRGKGVLHHKLLLIGDQSSRCRLASR